MEDDFLEQYNQQKKFRPANQRIENLLTIYNDKAFYCLLDIDDFGNYNYKYGFEKGNTALNKIKQLAYKIVAPCVWIRLDGDEYIFSCLGHFQDKRVDILKFMQEIKRELGITVSIGVVCDKRIYEPRQILSRLKTNVQMAKNHGKDIICTNEICTN